MSSARAYLGGVTLMAKGPVGWSQTSGVAPHTRVFHVHDSVWGDMEANLGRSCELVVGSESTATLKVSNLYPLREVPSNHPNHRAVMVADIRWKWSREILVRSYNIPRRSGSRRLVGGEKVEMPVELLQGVDNYIYAYYSLKPGKGGRKKWRARDVLEDVLAHISSKCGHGYSIDGLPVADSEQQTIEGLDLAESAAQALARILSAIPKARVKIDPKGNAVVYDSTDLAASQGVLDSSGPATVLGTMAREISLDAIRPEQIHVYFHKECELRFDSVTEGSSATASSTAQANLDTSDLTMTNVVPLPDPSTTIDNQPVVGGTYVSLEKALSAWNNDLASIGKGTTPPQLTIANVRKHWFRLEQIYTALGKINITQAQANWTARIGAIRAHFRQTYQVPEPWRRRIKDMRPYRVGILDPFTGTKAAAQAWSQYCVVPSSKGQIIAQDANNDDYRFYWVNIDGYPGINGELYDNSPSPAVVNVVDKDLGIIHIEYLPDRYGMRASIIPSMLQEDGSGKQNVPTIDFRNQLQSVYSIDGAVSRAVKTWLSDSFRVAVCFTAMPAEPNDEGRLYKLTISPGSVQKGLRDHFQVGGGRGPDWHLVVPQGMLTAWYAWAKTVEAREGARILFGFDAAKDDNRNEVPGYEVLRKDELIPNVARAFALSTWAAFVNQMEGTKAVHMSPDLTVAGNIASISHDLGVDGRLISMLTMSPERTPLDPLAYIGTAVRPWVMGTVPEVGG